MNRNTVTIQDAVGLGLKKVVRTSKIILIAATILCLLLLLFRFSWWLLLLLPAGALFSFLYSLRAATVWSIWAYEHVADIHQLQRSAELAGILMRQSYNAPGRLVSKKRCAMLALLQDRFLAESVFADDPAIPAETSVYDRFGANDPVLILDSRGIYVRSAGFFAWDRISDDRIAIVSYNSMSPRTGANVSAGTEELFRFESDGRRIEIPSASLDITTWQLDLLLYTYRCRFSLR